MATLVEIPTQDAEILEVLGKQEGLSPDALARRVISSYVQEHRSEAVVAAEQRRSALEEAFEAFKDFNEDGLAFQQRMRDEW